MNDYLFRNEPNPWELSVLVMNLEKAETDEIADGYIRAFCDSQINSRVNPFLLLQDVVLKGVFDNRDLGYLTRYLIVSINLFLEQN